MHNYIAGDHTFVAGQPALSRLLRTAADQGLGHAYLLSGPDGMGLIQAALTVAGAQQCQQPGHAPCGACAGCRRVVQGNHPDIHLVLPEGDTLKLAQVRELQATLHLKSSAGGEKVGIIAHADCLSLEAANSLLKLLEEPPAKTIVLLTARNVGRLPPTILSRCQELRILPPSPQLLAQRLTAAGADEPLAQLAARLCGGDGELAEQWMKTDLLAVFEAIRHELNSLDEVDPLALAEMWERRGKEHDGVFLQLEMGLLLLRDALVEVAGSQTAPGDVPSFPGWHREGLCDSIRIMLQTHDQLRSNLNARLALEGMFLALRGVMLYARGHRGSLQAGG